MTLGYFARAVVQVLAAHAVVSTLAAVAVLVAWPRIISRGSTTGPSLAHQLFLLRMTPGAAALIAWAGILLGYALWEPAHAVEPVGPVALALAAVGAALVLSGAWRLAVAIRDTRLMHLAFVDATRDVFPASPLPAFVIDSRFPIVALVGFFVSRLFVARSVLQACDTGELRAVLAHEQAHSRAHDNLRRLVMTAAPDLLAWLPAGTRMLRDWAAKAELAADDAAAREEGRLSLASALVKVARLATAPAGPLPASTLYRGEPIAERVHRLLDAPIGFAPPRHSHWKRGIVITVIALGISSAPLWLAAVHGAIEALLHLGLR